MTNWRGLTAGLIGVARSAFGEPAVLTLIGDDLEILSVHADLKGIFFDPTEQVAAPGDDPGFDMEAPSVVFALADLPAALLAPSGWRGATLRIRETDYEVIRKPSSDGQSAIRLFLRLAA